MNNALTLELNFSLYTRYRSLADAIGRFRKNKPLSILEVGGKGSYLQLFLPEDNITLLDIQGGKEENYVQGDGRQLPFENKSFDMVVSTDVLEHINDQDRGQFIQEQIRVAKRGIVLAAPFYASEIVRVEREANLLYRKITNKDHPWLIEHIKCGLPSIKKTEKALETNKLLFDKTYNQNINLWSLLIKLELLTTSKFLTFQSQTSGLDTHTSFDLTRRPRLPDYLTAGLTSFSS